MNIYNYLEYYGEFSFKDKPFNEIDNVIFSLLSYINFNYIVSTNKKNKITLEEVANRYFSHHNKKTDKYNILAVRDAVKLLDKIQKVPRFKDVLVYNYEYIGNESSQFSAMTFEIKKDLCYIAFEGTDQLISGWKEDCKMAYEFPVEAHKYAINYINHNFFFNTRKLILGGHSKGGNLALVAGMYANSLIKRRIVNIYSNDGQGLRKAQIESNEYKSIEDRFIHIIPQNSVVGLLLRHTNKNEIVYSNKLGLLAHMASSWEVEFDHFKREKLSKVSEMLDTGIITWLDKYDDEKREKFVNSVFIILEENNIESLIQLKQNINLVFKIIKSSKNMDPIVKEMLNDLIIVFKDLIKENNWI